MKVWELMRDLESAPAGADVIVQTNRDVEKEIYYTTYCDPTEVPEAFERPFFNFIIQLK